MILTSLKQEISSCKRDVDRIKVLTDFLLQDQELVAAFAHPLGFIDIQHRKLSEESISFHFWSKDVQSAQNPYWPIHDHIYGFESTVLIGKVKNELIECVPSLYGQHCLYTVSYTESQSRLSKTTSHCAYRVMQTDILSQDENYSLPAGKFHQSTALVDNDLGITVTAFQKKIAPTSQTVQVIGPSDGPSEIIYERREMPVETLLEIMSDLLNKAI
jgi:hypothetical protein